MRGFKKFLLRGNLVELAVAFVVGVAFGALISAFVKDLITPLIAARWEARFLPALLHGQPQQVPRR